MNTLAELAFTDKDLAESWSRVKEDFWDDMRSETRRALQRLLETSMEVELTDLVGQPKWRRGSRSAYRNGSYERTLLTSMGRIEDLAVPRLRSGRVRFHVLPRYRRRSVDVDELVREMFLAGVATRRVEEVLAVLFGERHALSAGTVSKITKVLDKQVSRFHGRRLSDDYVYLLLDGIFLRAKSPVSSQRRCVLAAYGISEIRLRRERPTGIGR